MNNINTVSCSKCGMTLDSTCSKCDKAVDFSQTDNGCLALITKCDDCSNTPIVKDVCQQI
tara:strand:- start:288 stop:467 length:180 start_codon:yes stop_codon:yes gene_type:complete